MSAGILVVEKIGKVCFMKAKRDVLGSEAVEVAITAGIILCLAIGAVAVFGPTVATVFESDSSPIIQSSSAMKNSSNLSDPDGAGARTNLDKSLVTSKLITKAQTDSSIGSAVGQETTGATGGDAAIGGTYLVEDPDALYDSDPTTTGNSLLDAALAAKNSALDLLNNAISAETLANVLDDKVQHLLDKVAENNEIVAEISDSLAALTESANKVKEHLDLLVLLKATALGISVNILDALNFTEGINTDILTLTSANLVTGQALLDLNQDQIAAYNDYVSMQSTYDASWSSSCTVDADGNSTCVDINTSGIDPADIAAQQNLSNMLLAQVNGQSMALDTTLGNLQTSVAAVDVAATDALNAAKDLENDSKDTLKEAFKDSSIFDSCSSIQDMIDVAMTALGNGSEIKNIAAAYDAITLLKQAGVAYEKSKQFDAKAKKMHNDFDHHKKTKDKLDADAASLALTASQQDTSNILSAQSATSALILSADPEISGVATELATVTSAVSSTTVLMNAQQVYGLSLADQATTLQTDTQDAVNAAILLKQDANTALADATQVIDDIVQFPGE